MAGDSRGVSISVLVPIYNVERYLDECLSSLRVQTFGDFEAICINDGSTDGSREIVQKYLDADARFRVIDKENSGYGASMNRGLTAAKGKYIAILESDDFFDPRALETLHDAAEKKESEVVKANFWLYWSAPEGRRELFPIVGPGESGRTVRPLDDIAIFFRKPSIWSALYRRDFLERNDINFLETPGASYQDAGFNFKVWASARKATFIDAPVLSYRQDNEGSSVNSSAKAFCVCDEYASMESFVAERGGADVDRLFAILERMKFDSYMWNLDRLDASLCEGFALRASEELSAALSDGKLDLGLFEPGARADLLALVRDPVEFARSRPLYVRGGFVGSVRHYLAYGGLPLLARVLLGKLRGRSVRRTDERGACA